MSSSGETVVGLMTFGKVFAVLAILVATILALAYLYGRITRMHQSKGVIQIIGSAFLGPKERVVVIDVAGQWLVLGIGNGTLTLLHAASPRERSPSGEASSSKGAPSASAVPAPRLARGGSSPTQAS